ncbi:helix-turn-helix domain-containing protein [Microbacterium horticulturae]|uniref:Helix-turn-helix domain-containing protein n=1 Tax=Microbacterium horticulturae TaxID=3028316 RepID=A0ABY8BXR1_9MICO|nr:helix-turn-helix domain-containing protein [Microbacterium sp. KACC 23027]WEG08297.1 helix-turn-helix domain-containing protein [Microbacterium sp. KACC 23027]
MTEHRAIEAAERGAAVMVAAGMPRMPARVMMALIAAPEGGYTAGELCERLGVSAAAVSGAVRYLQQLHFIQRRTVPGERRERYVLLEDAFYRSVVDNDPVYTRAAAILDDMAAELDDDPAAQQRAADIAGFMRFLARRMPQLIDEWAVERASHPGH